MKGFFRETAALKDEAQCFLPRRLSRLHHPLNARSDVGPNLMPDHPGRLSEGPGMLLAQGDAGIGIVVKEGELRAPGHPHREARSNKNAHRRLEAVGPRRPRGQVVL